MIGVAYNAALRAEFSSAVVEQIRFQDVAEIAAEIHSGGAQLTVFNRIQVPSLPD